MTVELARRLIESGVPLADIEAALLLVVQGGLPLSQALSERDPGLLAVLDQELARSELPSLLTVRPTPELCARLPAGMCQRLLAVPVHVDPRTGRVDVAAVEPLDPHIEQEFAFHLQAPIRVLLAPRASIRGALVSLQRGENISTTPSAVAAREEAIASDVPIPLVRTEAAFRSDAPIPLVRRSMLPTPSVAPAAPRRSQLPLAPGAPDPHLLSWRSRPPPDDLLPEGPPTGQSESGAAPRSDSGVPVRELLDSAETPDRVVELLRDGLLPAHSLVFTVKNASFDVRAASAAVKARMGTRQISLLSQQPSVLETAVKSGFYLGPIPNTPNHRELREALPPDAANEVYVTLVTVADRAKLVWLVAGFEQSLDLTRRADELSVAAGRALARILLTRKRGG